MYPNKRRQTDVLKLLMKDYKVEITNDDMKVIIVEFHGPSESLYQGGVWRIKVELEDNYPYKYPIIRFVNRIFHPNIEEMSGAICLDIINESWSPIFDLVNVFELFLPQLLLHPNPSNPMNGIASGLMMHNQPAYETKVKEHCKLYAKPEDKFPPKGESSDDGFSDGTSDL